MLGKLASHHYTLAFDIPVTWPLHYTTWNYNFILLALSPLHFLTLNTIQNHTLQHIIIIRVLAFNYSHSIHLYGKQSLHYNLLNITFCTCYVDNGITYIGKLSRKFYIRLNRWSYLTAHNQLHIGTQCQTLSLIWHLVSIWGKCKRL